MLGSLPTFQDTYSDELDELLSKFRSNVFLPAYLPKVQRDLVYRRKNKHLLTGDEPATVRIGDEVLQMVPLDRMRDEPKMRTSLHRIIQLMREIRDYRNLTPFMIGCRNSRRLLTRNFIERAVRTACEQGEEVAIMDCLKPAEKTGLKLCHYNIAETLISRATWIAVDHDWTEQGVQEALDFAESLWIMMQDPKQIEARKPNPMNNLTVVGVMVQLHAVKALKFNGQEGAPGEVVEYTQRLLTLWNKPTFSFEKGRSIDADIRLRSWAPIWHGMKLAREVSGITKEMREELGTRVKEVESALEAAREFFQSNSKSDQKLNYDRRGVKLYEKLSSFSL